MQVEPRFPFLQVIHQFYPVSHIPQLGMNAFLCEEGK